MIVDIKRISLDLSDIKISSTTSLGDEIGVIENLASSAMRELAGIEVEDENTKVALDNIGFYLMDVMNRINNLK